MKTDNARWLVTALVVLVVPAASACEMHERGGFGLWARMQYADSIEEKETAAPQGKADKRGAQPNFATRMPIKPATATKEAAEGFVAAAPASPEDLPAKSRNP